MSELVKSGTAEAGSDSGIPSYVAVWDGSQWVPAQADASGNAVMVGDVAHDAVDSGNPVKIGGIANAAPAAVASGDRTDALWGLKGALMVGGGQSAGADGKSNVLLTEPWTLVGNTGPWATAPLHFNGTSWDRQRGNTEVTILASAARTSSPANADITNHNGEAVDIIIDVTAISATPSVVFTVKGKDALSGQYYTILTSAAITGIGTTVLSIGRGLTAAANTVANAILPRTFQVVPIHADADSITYSVAANIGD